MRFGLNRAGRLHLEEFRASTIPGAARVVACPYHNHLRVRVLGQKRVHGLIQKPCPRPDPLELLTSDSGNSFGSAHEPPAFVGAPLACGSSMMPRPDSTGASTRPQVLGRVRGAAVVAEVEQRERVDGGVDERICFIFCFGGRRAGRPSRRAAASLRAGRLQRRRRSARLRAQGVATQPRR